MTHNSPRDAAVSEVIGVVLIIGLAVVLIAVLQISAVPVWNEEIELDHSSQVQDEMAEVRDAVLTTAGVGSSGSASIQLGTDYPNRIVLRSPPASTGRISTTESSILRLSNLTGDGNLGEYWENTNGELSTRSLVYSPSYNEYQNPPDTVYENTVLYNSVEGDNAVLSGQSLIDGSRITVVTLNGELSRESSSRYSVETEPLSAPSNPVGVTNTSTGNVTLELPGRLSVSTWRSLLEDERVENGGHVLNVEDTGSGVAVELEGGVGYGLRAAKVGVGQGATETESEYITKVSGDDVPVPEGTVVTLVTEVRDGYNNPVAGATVDASATGGSLNSNQETTGGDGRARFRYDTSGLGDGTGEVTVEVNGGGEGYESAVFRVGTYTGGVGGGGGGGAYNTFWLTGDTTVDVEQDGQTVDLLMGTSPVADGVRVEYGVNDTGIGTVSPDRDFTNPEGKNTTTLTVKENGSIRVYTSSGGSGDSLNVTVKNFGSQAVVYNSDGAAYDIDGGGGGPAEAVNFSVTNTGGSAVRITDMVIESPAATKLLEGSTSSPWDSEVRVDSNDGGYANEGNAYILGNSIAAYEDEGTFPNDLTAGETATVYMHKFLGDESNQVDMDGKKVTTTFSFQNRDPVSFTFTPTRPPTVFNSLTADASFRGQSGQIKNIDFSGSINNPDSNGVVKIAVVEGSNTNNNSVNMAGSFSINNIDTATNNPSKVDIIAELVNNDGDAYQTCQATLNEGSNPLSLGDFSCSTGPAQ